MIAKTPHGLREVAVISIHTGDRVRHPDDDTREGTVLDVRINPACAMRAVVVRWDDGEEEELEEIEFGPLED